MQVKYSNQIHFIVLIKKKWINESWFSSSFIIVLSDLFLSVSMDPFFPPLHIELAYFMYFPSSPLSAHFQQSCETVNVIAAGDWVCVCYAKNTNIIAISVSETAAEATCHKFALLSECFFFFFFQSKRVEQTKEAG